MATRQPSTKPVVHLQYVGSAGLVAIGSATGTHYRFDAANRIVAVDPRDYPSLAAIPHLRRVY
jgi:hypothetical protein